MTEDIGLYVPEGSGKQGEAEVLLVQFLGMLAVRMGDGNISQRFCALCLPKAPPSHEVCDCPCHPARELLSRTEEVL